MSLTENEVSNLLESLPDETDVFYPFEAREITKKLENPKNCLLNIIKNTSVYDEKKRFNALYCILSDLWSRKDFAEYRQLIETYEPSFRGSHIYFLTFKSQYYACQGKNAANCQLALEYASKAKAKGPNLPNILHLFTKCVIELVDVSADRIDHKLLVEAEDSINKAIAIKGTISSHYSTKAVSAGKAGKSSEVRDLIGDHYSARYYATKAHLLGKVGRFSEARELIQKAIEVGLFSSICG